MVEMSAKQIALKPLFIYNSDNCITIRPTENGLNATYLRSLAELIASISSAYLTISTSISSRLSGARILQLGE